MVNNARLKVHNARFVKDRWRTLEYCVTFSLQTSPCYVEGTDRIISGPEWTHAIDQFWRTDPRGRFIKLLSYPEPNPLDQKKEPY
jgi:hypothetical protein